MFWRRTASRRHSRCPGVTIASVTESATEGTPLEFEVSSDPAPTAALTVSITLDADGCTLVQSLAPTVTIAAGDARATLTVETTGVEVGDGCTVTAAIAPGDGYEVGDTATSASATLTPGGDADPRTPQAPAVTIAADAGSVAEGTPVSFTLTASRAPTEPLTVNVSWDQTGSFLTATCPPTVTIAAGNNTAVLSANTDDDSTDESNGSVTVSVLSGSGYTVGSPSAANVQVTDNDAAVLGSAVSISSVTPNPVTEGNTIAITVAISPPFPSATLFGERAIVVRIIDSSSTSSSHLVAWPAPGLSTYTFPTSSFYSFYPSGYTVDDDDPVTTNRTVVVSLASRANYSIGSPSSMTVVVNDASP